jgi:hypothetical protein
MIKAVLYALRNSLPRFRFSRNTARTKEIQGLHSNVARDNLQRADPQMARDLQSSPTILDTEVSRDVLLPPESGSHTAETSVSAVHHGVLPRFIAVLISSRPELDHTLFMELVEKWGSILNDIDSTSKQNPVMFAAISEGVDGVVHKFASATFKRIHSYQLLSSMQNWRLYDYAADIRGFVARFFDSVDICIKQSVFEQDVRANVEQEKLTLQLKNESLQLQLRLLSTLTATE